MPENMQKAGTSIYVQGVEVPADYNGNIPEGFDDILDRSKTIIIRGAAGRNCHMAEFL